MKDTFEEALAAIKHRLSNPIIGSYFLSFLIFNWPIILMSISDQKVDYKINYIRNHLDPISPELISFNTSKIIAFLITHPLLAPLILSAIYLFMLPYFFRPLNNLLLNQKINSENDKSAAEEKLTPVQEKIKLLQSKLENEIKKFEAQQSQLTIYEENMNSLRKDKKSLESNFAEEKIKLREKHLNELDSVKIESDQKINDIAQEINNINNQHELKVMKSNELIERLNKTLENQKDVARQVQNKLDEKERFTTIMQESYSKDFKKKELEIKNLIDNIAFNNQKFEKKSVADKDTIEHLKKELAILEKSSFVKIPESKIVLEELKKLGIVEDFRKVTDIIALSVLRVGSYESEKYKNSISTFARKKLITRDDIEYGNEIWILTDLGAEVASYID